MKIASIRRCLEGLGIKVVEAVAEAVEAKQVMEAGEGLMSKEVQAIQVIRRSSIFPSGVLLTPVMFKGGW